MAIELKQAQRKKVKLKIGISAPAGGGKTMGALIIAYGLVKGEHPKWTDEEVWDKIVIIDTENGSGELYSGTQVNGTSIGKYNAITLEPPFEPSKFIEAIRVSKEANMEVAIIDSLSHAWSGQGGLLEKQGNVSKRTGNSYTAWREVTPLHNQMIDSILQTDIHVIATMRSKTEYVQEKDASGRTTVRKIGLAPVQREGMEFEFSMFMEIDADHQAYVSKDRTNVFADRYFTITPEVGKEMAKWLAGGVAAPVKHLDAPQKKTESPDVVLKNIIDNITNSFKAKVGAGFSKDEIYDAIAAVNDGSKRYDTIKSVEKAQEVLEVVDNYKTEVKE